MAAAYLTHLAGNRVEDRSAGSAPAASVNPAAVAAMAEEGIDMSAEIPKALTNDAVRASDVVITMGCGDSCPSYPGKRYEDWQRDDPAGQGVDSDRAIRDEIRARIEALIADIAPMPWPAGQAIWLNSPGQVSQVGAAAGIASHWSMRSVISS